MAITDESPAAQQLQTALRFPQEDIRFFPCDACDSSPTSGLDSPTMSMSTEPSLSSLLDHEKVIHAADAHRSRLSSAKQQLRADTTPQRPVVAIDVDEVLGCYLEGAIQWHNAKYGTTLKYDDFFSYNFCEVWGGTDEEALEKCTEYMLSEGFKSLKVIEGAVDAVQRLASRFDLAIVTSRQNWIQEETIRWLNVHFPNAFTHILFGNHWVTDPNAKRMTKRELCESIGAVALIDDNPKYILDVADSEGIAVAVLLDLHGKNGWSKNFTAPDSVKNKTVKCHTWADVCTELEKLLAPQAGQSSP